MFNEAKTLRPKPELRGWGRGQFLEVEAKAEANFGPGAILASMT